MSLLNPDLLHTTTVLVILLHLFFAASCIGQRFPSSVSQGQAVVTVEKTRLGSTPPTCHNRCNECHPCMAVQVPTLPSRDRAQPGAGSLGPFNKEEESELLPSMSGKMYSNYKPLGWKCRCGNRLFNP